MKKRNCLITSIIACLMTFTSAIADNYHDVSSMYLKNNCFDTGFHYPKSASGNVSKEILDIDGWTKDINVDYTITGIYEFGTSKTFNGASVPATGQDGTATGGCLALSTGWGESLLYFQNAELPKGQYALVSAIYNCSDKTAGTSKIGWIPASNSASMSNIKSFKSGTWIVDTIKFEITENTKGKLQIGYTAGSGGSANSAKIVIDYIKLLRDTPIGKIDIDVYKENLNKKIAEASALYGEGTGNCADELKDAIDEAIKIYNNDEATIDIINNAIDALNNAIEKYNWDNPTGEKPTVTTNNRYARGATMAFARMSVSGSGIIERGICWSESAEPTINDNRTTEYLSNSGNIYWLKDLKPATKYYMRAYAITKGKQIGYGETIKFYTIPMGNITYTIRQDGDNATIQRITNAVKTAAYWWNNLTEIKNFDSSVGFVDGTPTADCSYGGWVRIGNNQSYQKTGTILHEWLHGVGVIPWADTEWSRHNLRSSINGDGYGTGTWLGDRVTEIIRFLDNNSTGTLNGDYQHMWPWGINGAHEDNGTDILYIGNSLVCQALGEDGLQHTHEEFAQPYYAFEQEDTIKYYIKSESADHGLYNSYLTIDKTGNLAWKAFDADMVTNNDSAAWYITFTPDNQYYQIRNAASNRYITFAGNGNNGFKTIAKSTPTENENLHLMRSRIDTQTGNTSIAFRGYWLIHPTKDWTPPCLTATTNGMTSTETFNIANKSISQRWLILEASDVNAFADKAVEGIKGEVISALEHLKKLYAVPHKEDTEGINLETENVIKSTEQLLTVSYSSSEIQKALDNITKATMNFLCNATPSDITKPFDLTSLLANTGMDTNTGWSDSPAIQHSTGEFYQTAFDMYQTIRELPAGTYQFCVQAFQRPGSSTNAYNAFINGTNSVSAHIYIGAKSQKAAHIATEAQISKLGKGSESTVGSPNRYMPNDRESARAYFDKGYYENRVTSELEKDRTSLKMGIRSGNMATNYWCCFDNFRLYFYGNISIDEVNSIDDINATYNNIEQQKGIYSIDGRLISPKVSDIYKLRPGIYIVDGKKVIK